MLPLSYRMENQPARSALLSDWALYCRGGASDRVLVDVESLLVDIDNTQSDADLLTITSQIVNERERFGTVGLAQSLD